MCVQVVVLAIERICLSNAQENLRLCLILRDRLILCEGKLLVMFSIIALTVDTGKISVQCWHAN